MQIRATLALSSLQLLCDTGRLESNQNRCLQRCTTSSPSLDLHFWWLLLHSRRTPLTAGKLLRHTVTAEEQAADDMVGLDKYQLQSHTYAAVQPTWR